MNEEYLGDAVYASFDGYQIWLRTGDGNNQRIALEPAVFNRLVEYEKQLRVAVSTREAASGGMRENMAHTPLQEAAHVHSGAAVEELAALVKAVEEARDRDLAETISSLRQLYETVANSEDASGAAVVINLNIGRLQSLVNSIDAALQREQEPS